MIPEFIQKSLLKNEKTNGILIKDEKLKTEILNGIEINADVLSKVFNKNILKRKDFTRLEEIIKSDLDKKISELEDHALLFDLISEDFKRFDIHTIKSRLLKKEYSYITGKTLYEHLINKKENSLEIIKQNRLLYFLDIPFTDWNMAENLNFEKYFRIPLLYTYSVFYKNHENIIRCAKFVYSDTLEFAEFQKLDNNLSVRERYTGTAAEISDFYRFDLTAEKHNMPCVLFIPKSTENNVTGNIILFENPKNNFVSYEAVFLKAKNNDDFQELLQNENCRTDAGIWFYNNFHKTNPDYNEETFKNRPVYTIHHLIAGKYICYTIGKDKDRIRSQKLVINKDCTVQFSSSGLHFESGYANITDAEKILQIHFHFEEGEYKYTFLLHLNNNDLKTGRLQGVVCGINRLNEPFAERVYVVKIDDEKIEPEDFQLGNIRLEELLDKYPELLQVFLGIKNDFGTDFQSLQTFYQNFYLPKQQNIERICGVFEVFSFDSLRECLRKMVVQFLPNGDLQVKMVEKGQIYQGKAQILMPDVLFIKIFKSTVSENFHGTITSLLDGFDIEGIQNFIAFYTGKSDKNELVCTRQVFVKSANSFENTEPGLISVHNGDFESFNTQYKGLGLYLTGKTNNLLKTRLTINHNLKPETDFGQIYFESACYSALQNDKTRVLQQLENAFNHGFRNKELLKHETENGCLKPFKDFIEYK